MKTTRPPYELSTHERRFNVYYKSFPMHIKYSGYYIYEYYMSYYSLLLIVIGTTCNLTSFLIMMRKPMRKHPCMRYLAMLSITDVLVLYQWNLNTFFKYHLSRAPLHLDMEEISLFLCRWLSYMAFSSLQQSAWLLALVSFDRLMIVYSTVWSHTMNKSSRINAVIAVLILTIFTLNSHIWFKNGYIVYDTPQNKSAPVRTTTSPRPLNVDDQSYLYNYTNETSLGFFSSIQQQQQQQPGGQPARPRLVNKFSGLFSDHQNRDYHVACYKSKDDPKYIFPKWERAHLIIYNAFPFSIMLLCNSLIIYNIKFKSKVQSKAHGTSKRKRRMTVMLIIVTFSFMILTLPSVIVHTFFREILLNKPYRRFVNLIVNNLLHTSHAINFFFYVLSAPNFRNEFIRFINELKRVYRRRFSRADDAESRNRTTVSVVSARALTSRVPPGQLNKSPGTKAAPTTTTASEELKPDDAKLEAESKLLKSKRRVRLKNGSTRRRGDEDDDDEMSSSSSSSTSSDDAKKSRDGEFRLTQMASPSKTTGALTSPSINNSKKNAKSGGSTRASKKNGRK